MTYRTRTTSAKTTTAAPAQTEAQTKTIELFRQAVDSGLSSQQACYALMKQGVSMADAADACWRVETGRAAPSAQVLARMEEHRLDGNE